MEFFCHDADADGDTLRERGFVFCARPACHALCRRGHATVPAFVLRARVDALPLTLTWFAFDCQKESIP